MQAEQSEIPGNSHVPINKEDEHVLILGNKIVSVRKEEEHVLIPCNKFVSVSNEDKSTKAHGVVALKESDKNFEGAEHVNEVRDVLVLENGTVVLDKLKVGALDNGLSLFLRKRPKPQNGKK